ncbi:MAG: Unknown protein [uncultured Sulfurovum sp.]|uniref:Lipoprotein n=1 Tax=uncultured Sulfurovum sp. TaxID=269237 RepID=A0A6S6TEV0_9BACT|nr:MAG: Unknown protein [uncultured Sulfurovum sp.]
MRNVIFINYLLGLSFVFSACDVLETSTHSETNIGYFVSNFNDNINYSCKNERGTLKDSGKFECASFPISFYMDGMKIGEISTIHSDGYVYPQDIILLEDSKPVYSSEGNINFLSVE